MNAYFIHNYFWTLAQLRAVTVAACHAFVDLKSIQSKALVFRKVWHSIDLVLAKSFEKAVRGFENLELDFGWSQ